MKRSKPQEELLGSLAFFFVLTLIIVISFFSTFVPIEERFSAIPLSKGPYSYIRDRVADTGEQKVDLLFVGASGMYTALDLNLLEGKASDILGRDLHMELLANSWRSEEMLYIYIREVLKRRQVGAVVWGGMAPYVSNDIGHPLSHYLVNPKNELFAKGLPIKNKMTFLAGSIVASPKLTYSNLFKNSMSGKFQSVYESHVTHKGSLMKKKCWEGLRCNWNKKLTFPTYKSQDIIHSMKSYPLDVVRTVDPLNRYQTYFTEKLIDLLHEKGVKLYLLNRPLAKNLDDGKISVRDYPSKMREYASGYIGLPNKKLFYGLKKEQVHELYYNVSHFNYLGSQYHSSVLLPAFLHILKGLEP